MLRKVYKFPSVAGYIVLSFSVILFLEFSTPPELIFGYLYVGPILLANWFLDRKSTLFVTALGVAFTMANLLVPRFAISSSIAVIDRLITVTALLTVAYLGARFRDVQEEATRQKAALQAQQELARVQEDFVATLSHDLKTPLLGARQTLAFFDSEQFGAVTGEQHQVLSTLQKSNSTQLAMVDTLLAIYRNDISGIALQLSDVDLDELCAEQIMVLQDLALSRDLELNYEGCDDARLKVDSLQLGRVVSNLVSNAINHTPRGGKVRVQLFKAQAEFRLIVEDTGSGIPPLDIKRIFERFYQSEGTRHTPGTGLGLYLSRQIVEAHNGRIWAANRAEGGCTFGISLPVPSIPQHV